MKSPKIIFIIAIALTIAACKNPELALPAITDNNLNLNSLLTLRGNTDTLYSQDYILNPTSIDSVSCKQANAMLTDDKRMIIIRIASDTQQFFDVKIWVNAVPYSVPCRRNDKIAFRFTFDPQGKTHKRVQIAGQMNDWAPNLSPDLKPDAQGMYEATLQLSPGNYLYQMLIDGEQNHDPNNPNKVDNGYGKFNSILHVKGFTDKYPELTTDNFNSKKISVTASNKPTEIFAFWQNYRLPEQFIKINAQKDSLVNIEISLPAEAAKTTRSFLRVWASNEFGVSNDIYVPLQNGKVLTQSADITRHDHHAQIMYFLLVDRFKNGDKSNDRPINRADVNPKVDFFGGDLSGVRQAIDKGYFNELGINTLWISPLNQNPDEPFGFYAPANTKFSPYHGYWPVSFSKVDSRFGSNEELKNLIANAHQKEMNVLLDYVAHHVHEQNPLYSLHPEYFTSLYLPDGTLNTERWNDHRLTTWFDTFMPTFNYENPKVVEMMTDSALFWLNHFQLDGFRHDACKHVDLPFWRTLTNKIKKNNNGKSLYQIGETYGSPELIASYLNTGMLNGQFDFNVFEDANTSFAGVGVPDLNRLKNVLLSSLRTYGTHNLMGYISGNHDKPRFMALASGDLKFGEDSKAAGWQREIGITDSVAFDKMALMQTFILTIPGVPVIYYGDEIGLTGANDPDCRRMMKFDGLSKRENNLRERVKTLAALRKNNPVFIYGDFINIQSATDHWAYARKYFKDEAIILINNSDKMKEITIELPTHLHKTKFKSTFDSKFKTDGSKLTVSLPPYSSEILL